MKEESKLKQRNEEYQKGTATMASTLDAVENCIPMPLLDRLKAKRTQIAGEMTKRLKLLDRQINLLEGSGAEQIVRESEQILYNE